MKFSKKKTLLVAVAATVGIVLMLVGTLAGKGGENVKSTLELRYEEAITGLEGISEAEVIIQEKDGKITGAVAVCKGGTDSERETVTKLLSSGLDLPANRIYVVCN